MVAVLSAPLIFLLEAAVVAMLPRQAVTGPLQLIGSVR
jgi:hypothetical protein